MFQWGLTNNKEFICGEVVFWDFQVEGGGAFPDATRGVIVGSVAGAVVAAKLASVGDGNASKVGAHADEDQPVVFLDTLLVVLGVT